MEAQSKTALDLPLRSLTLLPRRSVRIGQLFDSAPGANTKVRLTFLSYILCGSLNFHFHLDMREPHPEETFGYLISKLRDSYPDLAYIHVIEPRMSGDSLTTGNPEAQLQRESNDFIRDIWQPRPLITAGGFSGASAKETIEEKDGLVAFGRHFIANVRHLALSPT